MGSIFPCLKDTTDSEAEDHRIEMLQTGGHFKRRRTMMGITTGKDVLSIRLSDDRRSLDWRTVGGGDNGHVNVRDVAFVKAVKQMEFAVVGRSGDTLQQVEAESTAERDAWVTSLTGFLRTQGRGVDTSDAAEKAQSKAEGYARQKQRSNREADLERRRLEREELKKRLFSKG